MSHPDHRPLDPAGARALARVRRLMAASLIVTTLAIAAVLAVVGYRVFRSEGNAVPADVTDALPKGARLISTAVTEGRIVVTMEVAGQTEVRLFDLRTLKPVGRLRLPAVP
jgi:hypothetical protein